MVNFTTPKSFGPAGWILVLASLLSLSHVITTQAQEQPDGPSIEEEIESPKAEPVPLPSEPAPNVFNQSHDPGKANEDAEAEEDAEADIPVPEISNDLEALPFPARRMRELILEATKSGDIEKLRALIGTGDSMTLLSLGGLEGDPIDFLKQQSGDKEGHELLAILEEILEAGYAHLDAGSEHELFVWPYFYAYPLDKLTPRQRVELFRIVTHGDYQDMEDFGGYIFYRIGITPSGRWQFFVAGD